MTEKLYYEFRALNYSLAELKEKEHKLCNEITDVYHDISIAIIKNDVETFKRLNDKSGDIHCALSAIRILINQKESDLG